MTKRLKKYLDKARILSHSYSPEEIRSLEDTLYPTVGPWGPDFDWREGICGDLYDLEKDGKIDVTRDVPIYLNDEEPKRELTFGEFLLVYERKLFLFLLLPLEKMPLWISHPRLGPAAVWRLKLGR